MIVFVVCTYHPDSPFKPRTLSPFTRSLSWFISPLQPCYSLFPTSLLVYLSSSSTNFQINDPLRSFTGREKYKRPLWVTDALDKPSVTVQEMVMLSTSVLSIRWTIKGRPKSLLASVGGDLIVKVSSKFTLNQISGQVIEHEESWDLSASSAISQAYFWTSRRLFSAIEAGKDLAEAIKNTTNRFTLEKQNIEIYPDPSGDPRKFFQWEDNFQRDAYQIAIFLALLYFVVQFLKNTL